jgi:hypothetical protein
MNARIVGILVALLVVLGGGALVYFQQERSRQASNVASLGQPLLKDLKAADIAAIRIVEPKATLTLAQKDGRWTIAERGGFPADVAKVREFVVRMIELKVAQSEPIGEQDRVRLALEEPGKDGAGTLVEFRSADGKALARLVAGKPYFKRESEGASRAADGRFVVLPASAATVVIVPDPLAQASARSADWIDTTAFKVEKVKAMEVRFPGGDRWKIERARDDANWKLAGLRAGEKVSVTRANSASYSLSLVELADVAPPGTKPADAGLDKPIVVEASTLDGLHYGLKIGKLEGDNYYVGFKGGGSAAKDRRPEPGESAADRARRDQEHAERIAAIEKRLPYEKLLSEHVLLVPKSKLEDVLKKRSELLEPKAAKK